MSKISNFTLIGKSGNYPGGTFIYATVEFTRINIFLHKIITTKLVYNAKQVGPWRFVDTGEFTPGYIVEELSSSYEAKNGNILLKLAKHLSKEELAIYVERYGL